MTHSCWLVSPYSFRSWCCLGKTTEQNSRIAWVVFKEIKLKTCGILYTQWVCLLFARPRCPWKEKLDSPPQPETSWIKWNTLTYNCLELLKRREKLWRLFWRVLSGVKSQEEQRRNGNIRFYHNVRSLVGKNLNLGMFFVLFVDFLRNRK